VIILKKIPRRGENVLNTWGFRCEIFIEHWYQKVVRKWQGLALGRGRGTGGGEIIRRNKKNDGLVGGGNCERSGGSIGGILKKMCSALTEKMGYRKCNFRGEEQGNSKEEKKHKRKLEK